MDENFRSRFHYGNCYCCVINFGQFSLLRETRRQQQCHSPQVPTFTRTTPVPTHQHGQSKLCCEIGFLFKFLSLCVCVQEGDPVFCEGLSRELLNNVAHFRLALKCLSGVDVSEVSSNGRARDNVRVEETSGCLIQVFCLLLSVLVLSFAKLSFTCASALPLRLESFCSVWCQFCCLIIACWRTTLVPWRLLKLLCLPCTRQT